jgi:hypothetical protein
MRALLVVDVIKDFEHEDGDRLLASFRKRHRRALDGKGADVVREVAPRAPKRCS